MNNLFFPTVPVTIPAVYEVKESTVSVSEVQDVNNAGVEEENLRLEIASGSYPSS